MITIWTYNLVTFEVNKVEVDEIVRAQGKNKDRAVIKRNKDNNTSSFLQFTYGESDSKEIVRKYIFAELQKRESRIKGLVDAFNKLSDKNLISFELKGHI